MLTSLTWRGLTASYWTDEREMMRAIAQAVEEGREERAVLEFIHECKALFDARLDSDTA